MRRFFRGLLSIVGVILHPLGPLFRCFLVSLRTPERLDRGLILILPGIEGESFINHSIAWGLADAGVDAAIEIFDWTTGLILLFPYHLRGARRHRRQADRLAQRIVEYRAAHPGKPVHLIGHSGGGAMSLLALAALPEGVTVTSAILLAPAISPQFEMRTALTRSERGVWNFRSSFDLLFEGIGTVLLGTVDGRHTPAAGVCGFREPFGLDEAGRTLYREKLHTVPFTAGMITAFHFGGHLGSSNRVFVAEYVAPLICSAGPRAERGAV